MTGTLRVLAIGSKDALDIVRNALRFRRRSHLLVASNYWELCSLSIGEAVQVSVVVIEVSNSDRDLLRTAVHIRRRWPDAQILLMGREPEELEDPLYDERNTSRHRGSRVAPGSGTAGEAQATIKARQKT
jgi:hypothetical protein